METADDPAQECFLYEFSPLRAHLAYRYREWRPKVIRIIIKTERRVVPGGPIIDSYEVIEIDAPDVADRIRSGGYNEDGTFAVSQVVGVEAPRT
jgi:hypothetical protein